jgi:GNAT superfamily N-acetyltransferase
MAGVHLRVAMPADETAVTALFQASYPVLMREAYPPEVLAAALPLMTRANPKLLASGRFVLALSDEGETIGCGGWSLDRPGTGEIEAGLAHIRHFATHPGAVRRGAGRAIFDACRRGATDAGCRAFECYSSLNGETFYAALGFRRVSEVEVQMGPTVRFPSVLMICDIA